MAFDTSNPKDALASLPAGLRTRVSAALVEGVVPADRVGECLAESGWEIETLMLALLPLAAAHARARISDFAVGAVALGMSATGRAPGSLYLGANMEFPGEALCLTIHAEQSAVNNAWLHGEEGIRVLAVNAAPCGICRQFLNELTTAEKDLRVIHPGSAMPSGNFPAGLPLSALLPGAFGPRDLGVMGGGLMRPDHHELALQGADPLAQAALEAAKASYAPYTRAYAGIALRAADGKIYRGRYAENAAYNPSLLAVQSALALMGMQSGPAPEPAIVEAVLVESGERTSQRDVTRVLLESIGAKTTLACHRV